MESHAFALARKPVREKTFDTDTLSLKECTSTTLQQCEAHDEPSIDHGETWALAPKSLSGKAFFYAHNDQGAKKLPPAGKTFLEHSDNNQGARNSKARENVFM